MSDSLQVTRTRIENALTLIDQQRAKAPAALERTLELSRGALASALQTLAELQAQLDAATDPNIDAAAELTRVQRELEAAVGREQGLSLKLRELEAEVEVSNAIQAEEERRARDLDRKVNDFQKKLMTDDAAFDRYMDAALDADERRDRS